MTAAPSFRFLGLPSDSPDSDLALRSERERFRDEFLRKLPDSAESRQLSAKISGADFFIKDLAGRYVHASSGFLKRLGLLHWREIVGSRDEDHFPAALAAELREEAQRVLATGSLIDQRFDLRWHPEADLVWYETSTQPLHGEDGVLIGVIGLEHPLVDAASNHPERLPLAFPPLRDPRLAAAIDFTIRHCDHPHSNREIAEAAGISERQLSRLFLRHLRTTPGRFCCLLRVHRACRRLAETEDAIESIAQGCGFSDQSAFTNRFRNLVGTTPGKFRKRHWKEAANRSPAE